MGYYIETPEHKNKAVQICEAVKDAVIIPQPKSYKEIPEGKAIICVVDNGPFEAAAFCYNEREFEEFAEAISDTRPKKWVLMDRATAEKLSGYSR
jgi:hypothetical protein